MGGGAVARACGLEPCWPGVGLLGGLILGLLGVSGGADRFLFVMLFRVDRRSFEAEPDEEAVAALRGMRDGVLEQDIQLAKLYARLHRKNAHRYYAASSVPGLAGRLGFDESRAYDLMLAGFALEALDGVEAALRGGEVTFRSVVALGRIYRDPAHLLFADDAWLEMAKTKRAVDVERRVRKRIASERERCPEQWVKSFRAEVGPKTIDDLQFCRIEASRRARRQLDNGQLLSVLALSYRLAHDPAAVRPRKRRMPPTELRPHDRGVAAETERGIAARSGGLCEFGACERPAVDLCHLRPHRFGSGRELRDLAWGCPSCHVSYDRGDLELLRFNGADQPVFFDVKTGHVLVPKPPPDSTLDLDRPGWLLRAVGRTPKPAGRRGPPGRKDRDPGERPGRSVGKPGSTPVDPRPPPEADGR